MLPKTSVAMLVALVAAATAGCVSHGRMCQRGPGAVSDETQAQAANVRDARAKYQDLFQRAATVEEAKAAEREVARLDRQAAELEQRAAIERRGRQEPRTIVYGPIGFVLKLTEFILDKLYIWEIK